MEVVDTNSKLAQFYEDNSSLQYRLGKQLIAQHLRPSSGQRVLDLGCGTGRLATEIAVAVGPTGSVLGVDPNTERIRVAKVESRRRTECPQNISFISGVVHDALPYGKFDAIFSNFVLHWVQDEAMDATVASIETCLKPGGALCAHLTVGTGAYADDLSRLCTGLGEEELTGMRFRSLDFLTRQLSKAGLQVENAFQDEVEEPYSRVGHYFDFVKAYSEGKVDVDKIPDAELSKFMSSHGIQSLDDKFASCISYLTIVARKPRTNDA